MDNNVIVALMNKAKTGVYKAGGSCDFDELPEPSADTLNLIYDVNDAFTSNDKFKHGAGIEYPAGTNVAVVNAGTNANPIYKYDALAGSYITDSELSENSTNPVENRVVTGALSNKVDKVEGKGLSTNDYTTAEKEKLAGLANYDDTEVKGDISDIQAVIPENATEDNKLSTAADVNNEEISSTASGTSITLTDSADGYVQGITVNGKSRKTKNLLEITETTQTINDVTFTVDKMAGKITISGTASADTSFMIGYCKTGINAQIFGINSNDATKYWVAISIGDAFSGRMYQYKDSRALDLSSETRQPAFFIGIASGTTVNDVIYPFEMTVADYTSDPTFEPYFDGIKSIGDAGWGVVDLGTLTWTMAVSGGFSCDTLSNMPTGLRKMLCSKYNCNNTDNFSWGSFLNYADKTVYCNKENSVLYIKDTSYTDATTFASAMSGVLLYYPLADATGATPILGITSKDGAGQGTAATITTALPLRSVSDSIYDTLDNTQVVTRVNGGKINDTNIFNWTFYSELSNNTRSVFYAPIPNCIYPDRYTLPSFLITDFGLQAQNDLWTPGNISCQVAGAIIATVEPTITTVEAFLTAYGNEEIYYPLATPITTPLTPAEKSALASLRTYDSTTHIDATDEPSMTVDYLRNTENGKAVANVDERAAKQNAALLELIATPYSDTETYAQGDYCTHSGMLYKANAAIGTAEPFTAEHWTATTVMAEIT